MGYEARAWGYRPRRPKEDPPPRQTPTYVMTYRPPQSDGSGFGVFVGLGLALAGLILLLYAVAFAAIYVITVAPISVFVWGVTALLGRGGEWGFGPAFRVSLIGLFVYAAFTTMIALVAGTVDPHQTGALASLARAVLELRQESLASLALIMPGDTGLVALSGLLGSDMHPFSTRLIALLALHGPGLLMFAYVLNRYIDVPYDGVGGTLIALVLVLLAVPLSLGGLLWVVAIH